MRRTDDLVRKVVSEALLTSVQDPRIGMVTVTDVRVSPEFDTARVFVSILGDEEARRASLDGLRSAAPFLQSELAKAVRFRRIPKLKFIYDESVARGFRIDEVLRGLGSELGGATEDRGERDEPLS